MANASRNLYLAVGAALGICSGAVTTTGHGQTSTQLMTVRIQDEAGQPIYGAEAILVTETKSMPGHGLPRKWKPAEAGSVTFTVDDITSPRSRMYGRKVFV